MLLNTGFPSPESKMISKTKYLNLYCFSKYPVIRWDTLLKGLSYASINSESGSCGVFNSI